MYVMLQHSHRASGCGSSLFRSTLSTWHIFASLITYCVARGFNPAIVVVRWRAFMLGCTASAARYKDGCLVCTRSPSLGMESAVFPIADTFKMSEANRYLYPFSATLSGSCS